MIPSEAQEIINYFSPETPNFPANFTFFPTNYPTTNHHHQFNGFLMTNPLEFPQNSSNSTSDEAEDHNIRIIDERKQRRMISNRESARRSRMRKQRHLDELWSQVVRLRTEKHSLMDKLNHVSESHDRVVQENERLKEEASDLRQMLLDAQISSSCGIFRDLEDISCNTAHLRAESSNPSVSNSNNLLH